jgi:hypothetical protein
MNYIVAVMIFTFHYNTYHNALKFSVNPLTNLYPPLWLVAQLDRAA